MVCFQKLNTGLVCAGVLTSAVLAYSDNSHISRASTAVHSGWAACALLQGVCASKGMKAGAAALLMGLGSQSPLLVSGAHLVGAVVKYILYCPQPRREEPMAEAQIEEIVVPKTRKTADQETIEIGRNYMQKTPMRIREVGGYCLRAKKVANLK